MSTSSLKEKETPTDILMDSLTSLEGSTGVIIIVDREGENTYSLRSNLGTLEVVGLFEIAKHHLIEKLKAE